MPRALIVLILVALVALSSCAGTDATESTVVGGDWEERLGAEAADCMAPEASDEDLRAIAENERANENPPLIALFEACGLAPSDLIRAGYSADPAAFLSGTATLGEGIDDTLHTEFTERGASDEAAACATSAVRSAVPVATDGIRDLVEALSACGIASNVADELVVEEQDLLVDGSFGLVAVVLELAGVRDEYVEVTPAIETCLTEASGGLLAASSAKPDPMYAVVDCFPLGAFVVGS